MASRIKGITVEIGGDTTGLEKALKGVNTTIKSTQSALKDVTRLLKLDPTNTELLSQKQRFLKDAVSATKDKLDALKEAQSQAKAQLENGTLGQDKYDALQREIIETEQELRRLQEEAATTSAVLSKIDAAGQKMEAAGNAISGAGQKLMPITAGVAALGTAAVKTAADFDSSMSQVAAVSGATGDDLDALRDKAREMGAKTKFSASEAADAMNYMAMAGWKTEDMLGGIEGIMSLAAASGENLATTSDIVTDALTAFGLTAADSGHFADILAAASSNANTNVSMMGETFKYAAPVAGALGFSAEDTAEAIGLMANSGIKASQAGTSLRSIMNNLAGEVKFCGEELGEVTIATTNSDGSMRELSDILADCRVAFSRLSESEQAAAAESLVGKNAMSGFLALMNAGESDIAKLSGAIANCDGAAEHMAEVMQDNLTGQLTILKSQTEELAISFGEMLMPMIRNTVMKVQEFIDRLNGMNAEQRETILKIAAVAAAIGPLLIILGTVMSKTGQAMQGFVKLAQGFGKLKVAVSGAHGLFGKLGAVLGGVSGPVLAVVAVIAVLVAAFVKLWNTNEEFRDAMTAIWEGIVAKVQAFTQGIRERLDALDLDFTAIVETLKAAWDGFCELLAPVFEAAFSAISAILGTVLDVLTGLFDVFAGLFTGNWTQMWNGVKEIFSGVWNGVTSVFETALNLLRSLADTVLGWFGTNWETVWENVKSFFENVWNGITGFLSSAWETICNVVKVGVMLIGSILDAAWKIITLPFRLIWENCGDTITAVWDAISKTVSEKLSAIGVFIKSVMTGIQNTISSIWTAVSARVSAAVDGIKTRVSTAFNSVKSTASSVWNGVKSTISTAVDGIKTKVSSVMDGIKSVVSSAFESVHSKASSVWNSIKTAITGPVEAAKEKVRAAVNAIKGFFANMKLSLPHIKLPHFKVTGQLSITPPSVPKLSIDWYKEGGILAKPTIFGMNGSSLMAGGEAGAEAVLPLKQFYDALEAILANKLDMSGMEKYLAIIAANSGKGVYLDDGTLVGRLLPVIDASLGHSQKLNARLAL